MGLDPSGLPKKRVSAAVLLWNQEGKLLMVEPTYRKGWLLPGGMVEQGESPVEAALRETEEEIGLKLAEVKPRASAYTRSLDDESVQFIFDGGTLTDLEIQGIHLQEEELGNYAFVTIEEAVRMAVPNLSARLQKLFIEKVGPYFEVEGEMPPQH